MKNSVFTVIISAILLFSSTSYAQDTCACGKNLSTTHHRFTTKTTTQPVEITNVINVNDKKDTTVANGNEQPQKRQADIDAQDEHVSHSSSDNTSVIILAIVALVVALAIVALIVRRRNGSAHRGQGYPVNNQSIQLLTTNGGWASFKDPNGANVTVSVNNPGQYSRNVGTIPYGGNSIQPLPIVE